MSRIWRTLAAILAALVPVVYFLGRRDANKRNEGNAAIEDQKAQDRGRKAVQAGRDSGASPDERVRANDGKWL